jgi:hypothetical protein
MAEQHEAIFNFNIAETRLWSRTHAQSIPHKYVLHAYRVTAHAVDVYLPIQTKLEHRAHVAG